MSRAVKRISSSTDTGLYPCLLRSTPSPVYIAYSRRMHLINISNCEFLSKLQVFMFLIPEKFIGENAIYFSQNKPNFLRVFH